MTFPYSLPPKPGMETLMQGVNGAATIDARFRHWCDVRGITILDGPAIVPDGTILLDANRDPSDDWDAWDPQTLTPGETQERDRLTTIDTWIATLEGGGNLTATQRRQVDLRLLRMFRREIAG